MADHPDQIGKPYIEPDRATVNYCLIIYDTELNELRIEGKNGKPISFTDNDFQGFDKAPFKLHLGPRP